MFLWRFLENKLFQLKSSFDQKRVFKLCHFARRTPICRFLCNKLEASIQRVASSRKESSICAIFQIASIKLYFPAHPPDIFHDSLILSNTRLIHFIKLKIACFEQVKPCKHTLKIAKNRT